MGLIYEELTHQLIGCFFEVHNKLGVGYDEKAYHKALEKLFQMRGISFRSKERKTLSHRDCKVKDFEVDFIAFDKIILELKSLQSNFLQSNYIQILSELKLWDLRLGLLVNFGLQKVEFERIPFNEKEKRINENYDFIKSFITETERHVLGKLRDAILFIFNTHGLGYGESVYHKMLAIELDYRKINYQTQFPIEVRFEENIISTFKMKPILVENQIVCDIKALKDTIDFYDIAKIQSYLRALKLNIGIIVNFASDQLEIKGIRA
ncbi:MAG: GxxExxY protein [candidate division KSB1 bacterium]|nr:GxxExxY protein [candidate division KSB1 bacterium]